jgi:hypothetical protein
MSMFGLIDALDGSTQRLFTPCHACGHAHHCSKEKCVECECTKCDCDNCRAKSQQSVLSQGENRRFL